MTFTILEGRFKHRQVSKIWVLSKENWTRIRGQLEPFGVSSESVLDGSLEQSQFVCRISVAIEPESDGTERATINQLRLISKNTPWFNPLHSWTQDLPSLTLPPRRRYAALFRPDLPVEVVDYDLAINLFSALDLKVCIEDDSRLSVYQYGEDFLNFVESGQDPLSYRGPCTSDWVWLAIEHVFNGLPVGSYGSLVTWILTQFSGLSEADLLVLTSGKGQAIIGLPLGHQPAPSELFPDACQALLERISKEAKVPLVSHLHAHGSKIYAPNCRIGHVGLYVRRIPIKAGSSNPIDGIDMIARSPQPFAFPELKSNPTMQRYWDDAMTEASRRRSQPMTGAIVSNASPVTPKNSLTSVPTHDQKILSGSTTILALKPNPFKSLQLEDSPSLSDLYEDWKAELSARSAPSSFKVGDKGWEQLALSPGHIYLFGGAPSIGKTSLVMQMVTDGVRLNPEMRVLVCNVEMSSIQLLGSILARISGIPGQHIRGRQLQESWNTRIDSSLTTMKAFGDRLSFLTPPFTMEHVAQVADRQRANVIVVDYVQRFSLDKNSKDNGKIAIDEIVKCLRFFAGEGVAIIAISSLTRQRDSFGNAGYSNASSASFRESSELEYGADFAFILEASNDKQPKHRKLKQVKSRYERPSNLAFEFDDATQRFSISLSKPDDK